MSRSGGLLENYLGPIDDSLPGSRVQSQSSTVQQRGGKTLADELADIDDEFDSEGDTGDTGDDEYSSEESETSIQREAREEADRVVALHEKFLKDNDIRNDFADKKETKISPPSVPVSMAQQALPENRRPNTSASQISPTPSAPSSSHKKPPRPPPFSSKPTSIKHTQVSPRRVPSKERKSNVKPPPLSRGLFATISREYGWAWLWWIIIPLFLTAATFFAREHGLIQKQAAHGKNAIVEETNAIAIIDIASAISDLAKVVLDTNGTLMALKDSPLNQAVLLIASVRETILKAEQEVNSEYVLLLIDVFVAKNRDLDHNWRSFLQQHIEATAEFAGQFDGYAQNAAIQGYKTDWISAAHNITIQSFSYIPQEVYREGEFLMCELVGETSDNVSCPYSDRNVQRLCSELMDELHSSQTSGAYETFETYSAALMNIAKGIRETLKTWKEALDKIEAAKTIYNHEYGIGNVEKVAQELESTAETLKEAMESPLVYQMAAPEFPAAVRRLAGSKIRTLPLQ